MHFIGQNLKKQLDFSLYFRSVRFDPNQKCLVETLLHLRAKRDNLIRTLIDGRKIQLAI